MTDTLIQEAASLLNSMPRGTKAELSRRTGLSNNLISQIAKGHRLGSIGPHPDGSTDRVMTGRQMLSKAIIELRKMAKERAA